MIKASAGHEGGELTVELDDYLHVLRKSWVLILVTSLLSLGAAAGWSLLRTPKYEATTQLFVSVRTGETSVGDLSQGSSFAQQAVTSYVSIVGSAAVLDRVIDDLDLPMTRRELAKQVTADSPQDTVLINIQATDADPDQAVRIADTTSAVLADVIVNNLEQTPEGAPARVQVDVVQPAELPEGPASPQVPMNLLIGLVCGVLLGVAAAILRSTLDTKIRTKADLTNITSTPLIGAIRKDPEAGARPLIAQADPRSPLVEAYRSMRTNLQSLGVSTEEGNAKSIVITSAGPGEGKSTTAANLAIVMADTGARVALIDADLRKPTIARTMGIEGAAGLSDVLIGRIPLEDAIQPWGRRRLSVLPAGPIPPNPSELLGAPVMRKVLKELVESYDYVIVDAPPVLAVTDAAILSRDTGGAIMVAAAGKVSKAELASALESMKTVDGHVMGVVMTMVPTRGPDAHGYGVYAYQMYGEATVAAPNSVAVKQEPVEEEPEPAKQEPVEQEPEPKVDDSEGASPDAAFSPSTPAMPVTPASPMSPAEAVPSPGPEVRDPSDLLSVSLKVPTDGVDAAVVPEHSDTAERDPREPARALGNDAEATAPKEPDARTKAGEDVAGGLERAESSVS